MIKPINGHILIEPIKHESFIASQKETFEEVGIVIDLSLELDTENEDIPLTGRKLVYGLKRGHKVFFDSWLAAKFPKNETEYFWLVKFEDIRAIENGENEISE